MNRSSDAPARPSVVLQFLASEAAGGIILIAAALLAMITANSPLGHGYHDLLHSPISPALTDKLGPMTAHLWINDGLMAIFFLFVGLEIKRELVDGRLASWAQRRLPVLAAAAGMAGPGLFYLGVAGGGMPRPPPAGRPPPRPTLPLPSAYWRWSAAGHRHRSNCSSSPSPSSMTWGRWRSSRCSTPRG